MTRRAKVYNNKNQVAGNNNRVSKSKRHRRSDDVLADKIEQLIEMENDGGGLAIKVALLTGLRAEELIYAFSEEVCTNSATICCTCDKLHLIEKRNGLTIVVVNWLRNSEKKRQRCCYFTLLPTVLWQRFRSLSSFNESDIKSAEKVLEERVAPEIKFSCLRRIFFKVMSKTMDYNQINILAGKTGPSVASYCLVFELDRLIKCYVEGWDKVGLVLPVL